MQPDCRDIKPVYEQITDGIRKMIITHAIPEGEKLPSVRELASKFAVNPNAVRKAYQELEEEGYVCDREGERMAASEKQIAELIRKELLQEFDTVVIRLQNMSVGKEELTGRMWKLAGEAKTLIEVNNLIKKFGDFRALDGVNMHVASGNIYGLVGPNGAGKSTLIRHLTGVYRQDAGEIFIDGVPVYENKQVKAQMAYIPDEPFYFLQADTLEMMRYFRGMYESFDEKMFYRLQEFFPGIDMKRNIRRLSRGMQKQVAFWLALCCRPKLLILDEPLDGLDPVMRKQIWTILMSEVAERRTTVLVSSHNLRELEDVCDHVGIMNHGKVIIERSLFDLHGNISKIQVACQTGMPKLPKEFEILHMSNSGRVYTMIVKGNPREVAAVIQTEGDHLAIVDILPLTLEEIFIYEMGGLGYEVKDILF